MKVLFCRVGWMEFYRGQQGGDEIEGGGAYVEQTGRGGEVLNFASHGGHVYGFVQSPGKAIDIRRIARHVGESIDDAESISNVLIVWVARRKDLSRTVVVGWYRNATVFRDLQFLERVPRIYKENGLTGHYRFKVKADGAVLLKVDARTRQIPTFQTGYMGRPNIWYADSDQAPPVVDQVKSLIKGKLGFPRTKTRKTDPEHNTKVEKAAVRAVRKHFENLDYTVESVEKDNVGWDLEAYLGEKRRLRIEVKGLSGSDPVVELTPNEYEKFQEEADDYRLAIVTDALSGTPRLMICRFSGELREWIVEIEGKADGRMEVEPRNSARVRVVPAPA